MCSTDTVSDDHADCSGFRQSHHGDDSVVAAVLSVDVKVALKGGEAHTDTHSIFLARRSGLFGVGFIRTDSSCDIRSGRVRHSARSRACRVAPTFLLC